MSEQNNVGVVISKALQIPGIKVNRNEFLSKEFDNENTDTLKQILDIGPVDAGISKSIIRGKANKIIANRTVFSSGASFISGLPGGLAMTATIPADMIQYYAVALRLAQEIAYLYGEEDVFKNGGVDDESVHNRLILYLGVMLGATGASQGIKMLSSAVGKQLAKKLPQKALTKTFYYPIIKSILKMFGKQLTKETFGKGVGKAIPIVGGVFAGGITAATMPKMAKNLMNSLETAKYDYTSDDYQRDYAILSRQFDMDTDESTVDVDIEKNNNADSVKRTASMSENLEAVIKAKQMLDDGIITESEFNAIKLQMLNFN